MDQALRDRLVCGLRSEATQKRLLLKSDLTQKRALEIAQSQEAAERNTSTLSVESVTVSSKKKCYRCGGRNLLPWEYRFKEVERNHFTIR